MMKILKKILFAILVFLFATSIFSPTICFSQNNNVGIGTLTPAASALLDIDASPANNKGVLVPRLTAIQRLAIPSPANSLLVFDTDFACFLYWNAITTNWKSLCNTGSGGIGIIDPTGALVFLGAKGGIAASIIGTNSNTGQTSRTSPIGYTGSTAAKGIMPQGGQPKHICRLNL